MSQKKKDNFIKGAPASRVTQYIQGAKDKEGEFETAVVLTVEEDCCIRSEALESGRIAANSYLSKELEPTEDYLLQIKPYPHHVLRYHPLAGIAQADRYYEGMRKPFGRPIGRAAIVDEAQVIYRIEVDEDDVPEARKALERAAHKMPVSCRVKLDQ
jgi:large subunit ribosomal protein L10e